MKTTLGLFLGALLAISLAGCGDGGGDTKGGGGNSGGTTSGGTGGTGGDTGGTTSGPALSCDAYCTDIAANCTGDESQYSTKDVCLAVCAEFEPGAAGDTEGPTLGCHTYHSGAAKDDPATHCPHAGPLGDGACGKDCDNFCALAIAVCGDQAMPPYADVAACMTACMGFTGTDTVPYNASATQGDSLACRMYHLSVAATTGQQDTHCPHVGEASATCM